jgi:hypothetical protein
MSVYVCTHAAILEAIVNLWICIRVFDGFVFRFSVQSLASQGPVCVQCTHAHKCTCITQSTCEVPSNVVKWAPLLQVAPHTFFFCSYGSHHIGTAGCVVIFMNVARGSPPSHPFVQSMSSACMYVCMYVCMYGERVDVFYLQVNVCKPANKPFVNTKALHFTHIHVHTHRRR